jgi:hypothetical protein
VLAACALANPTKFLRKGTNFTASNCKRQNTAEHWWLTLVILATGEAEIRRIAVRGEPRQIVPETLS